MVVVLLNDDRVSIAFKQLVSRRRLVGEIELHRLQDVVVADVVYDSQALVIPLLAGLARAWPLTASTR